MTRSSISAHSFIPFFAKHVALLARSVRCLESDTVALDAMELRPAQDPHTSPCAIPGSRAEVHQRTKHPDVQAREQVASRPWRPQSHPRTSLPSQTDVLNLAAQLLMGNKTCLVVLDTTFTRDVILSKRDGLPKAPSVAEDLKHVLSHLCGERVNDMCLDSYRHHWQNALHSNTGSDAVRQNYASCTKPLHELRGA